MTADDRAYRAWWERTWHERGSAVRNSLGHTTPPGSVHSFAWDDPRLMVPGACALTFSPTEHRQHWLIITLGLTQPLTPGASGASWEFALYASRAEPWCYELLYDLVTGSSQNRTDLQPGHFLPVTFFRNARGQLDCAAENLGGRVERCNDKTGLYLWPSLIDRTLFEVSTGNFFLMAATIVTQDEETLADRTSPPHLLLLLKQLGIGQLSDTDRKCVTRHPRFGEMWEKVKAMPHEEAFRCLNAK